MIRRLLSLIVIAVAIFGSEAGLKSRLDVIHAQTRTATASASAQSATADRQAVALRTSDLGGLRLRSIGPATMSGRFVDMDVVESTSDNLLALVEAVQPVYETLEANPQFAAAIEEIRLVKEELGAPAATLQCN